MDSAYEWKGKEFPLMPGVNAIALTISAISEFKAEGTIAFKDYWEHGIVGKSRWTASAIIVNGRTLWIVTPRLEDGEESFWKDMNSQPVFTANDTVNEGIKGFVSLHVNACLAGRSFDLPKVYNGSIHHYSGPCVCADLGISSREKPFDWQLRTEGGKFAQNCFECSCGARWHCIDPDENKWMRVAEVELWHMLTHYNGVAVRQVGIKDDELYLLATLCEMGYVLNGGKKDVFNDRRSS